MQRHEAHKIAVDARNETCDLLRWVRAERLIGKEARNAVSEARDVLHAACSHFDDGDSCEEHEDLFLPLFDALSFVTGVLYGADWRRWHDSYRAFILANVSQALTVLDEMMRCPLP